jgi:hypothetical protein
MATYAKGTTVSIDKTQGDIRKEVQRFGASHFRFAEGPGYGLIEFVVGEKEKARWIRFRLMLPAQGESRFWLTPSQGKRRSDADARRAWDQACREHWRSLLLLVKAKLAAVQARITTVEEEFFAHTVDPLTDQTVYEQIGGEVARRIAIGLPGTAAVNAQKAEPLRLTGPIEPTEIIEPGE